MPPYSIVAFEREPSGHFQLQLPNLLYLLIYKYLFGVIYFVLFSQLMLFCEENYFKADITF